MDRNGINGKENITLELNESNDKNGRNLSFKESLGDVSRTSKSGDLDGSIILGKEAGRGNQYVTRFKIDRSAMQSEVTKEILSHAFCPCCKPEKKQSCRKFTWSIIKSESFLLTLHMTVLIIGVVKECLNLRDVDEDLHFAHSLGETLVAILLVITRVVAAWHTAKELKENRSTIEHVSSGRQSLTRGVLRAIRILTATGVFLILFAIGTFILFYFAAHLGWTILSNNFVLIVITVSSNLVLERMEEEALRCGEDHHKVVLYEALLLLTEISWAKTEEERKIVVNKANTFSKAIRDTSIFDVPEHIGCKEEDKPHWDMITNLEMLSLV